MGSLELIHLSSFWVPPQQTKVYQEAVEEGELKAKLEMVPVLLELGMTAEQIAARLGLEVSIVTGRLNR